MLALFSTLCYVEADVSHGFIRSGNAVGTGKPYHVVEVDVVLSLGLTELKASVSWTENVSVRLPFLATRN